MNHFWMTVLLVVAVNAVFGGIAGMIKYLTMNRRHSRRKRDQLTELYTEISDMKYELLQLKRVHHKVHHQGRLLSKFTRLANNSEKNIAHINEILEGVQGQLAEIDGYVNRIVLKLGGNFKDEK